MNHEGQWAEGTPSWSDLQVDDVAAAQRFYGAVFGWEFHQQPDEAGGYTLTLLHGRPVAGIGPKYSDAPTPSTWTSYFSAADADAVADRVERAGGQLLMRPMDVMTSGRMLVATDTTGAVFGVWQGKDHPGAAIVNEAGAQCWNDLHTPRLAAAQRFYADVFGYGYSASDGDDDYVIASLTGRVDDAVCGIRHNREASSDGESFWRTWFAVGDIDDAAKTMADHGGGLLSPLTESPFGRMGVAHAPEGETFGLIELRTP